jgi:hypothetical protein
MQVPGTVQFLDRQFGEQMAWSQAGPVHELGSVHLHTPGAVQLPFTHDEHTGWSHRKPVYCKSLLQTHVLGTVQEPYWQPVVQMVPTKT